MAAAGMVATAVELKMFTLTARNVFAATPSLRHLPLARTAVAQGVIEAASSRNGSKMGFATTTTSELSR